MRLTKRGLASACVVSAAAVAALGAPGAASAAQCGGVNIEGNGATLQKAAQEAWNKEFNISANPLACAGLEGQGTLAKPTVKYKPTGSGPGLESWGVERKAEGAPALNFGAGNAYVGTDEPPSPSQVKEIEASTGGKVLTIPVVQAAVAVDIHLPAGCKEVTGGPVPGRIALKVSTLEKVFRGSLTEWKSILNGAKLVDDGSKTCPTKGTTHITRVVRNEGSGTTSIFKKFLNVVYGKEVEAGKTWFQLAASANNVTWPAQESDPVVRGAGGGALVSAVAATPGSIGYASLADSRKNAAFSGGGAGHATLWAELENAKGTYADPSTNGESASKANSNCEETVFVNGKKKFPPPTALEQWNEVSSNKVQKNYVICGFSYDLSLTKFSAISTGTEAPSAGSVQTAKDYLSWSLDGGAGGGQAIVNGASDYLGLPTNATASLNVRKIAQEGASLIGF